MPLSPRLLKELRVYWLKHRPSDFLFPGKIPGKLYADTTICKAKKEAARKAGIKRRVYPHVLRHSCTTGLLEAGVDLLTIGKLLGHTSFITMMVYLPCRREHLHSAPSPLDWLPVRQLPSYQPPQENGAPQENGSEPKYQCQDCGEISSRYNSCGDRHCPQCSGSKRFDFNGKASKLLLPGVVYYHVVFTLPNELSELALVNRQEMADLLTGSAWKSLSKHVKDEQDFDPAEISVLHTWNQKLDAHWHVPLLVPEEGPGIRSRRWKRAQSPPESRNGDGYYLVDADRLRESYCKRAIAKLRQLRSDGKLKLGGKFE